MSIKKVMCHTIKEEQVEVEADKLIWRPSIYGILIEDDKVLLSKQWDGYDLPGGGAELHETMVETLTREFFEETGLQVEVIAPVYCGTSFYHTILPGKNQGQYWNCPLIYFLVKKVGGELSKANCDTEEQKYLDMPEWIEIDQCQNLKFYNSIDNSAVIKQAMLIKQQYS